MTTDEFVLKALNKFGHIFSYSKTQYQNYFENVIITCNVCQIDLYQTPSNHLANGRCKYCSIKKQQKTTEAFVKQAKEVHGNKYCYSKTKYINAKTKLEIICLKCNQSFFQLPRGHIYETSGCPKCRFSKGELAISKWLINNQIPFIMNYKFNDCINIMPLPFDFYIEKFKLCIEFDGKQHYEKESKFYNEQIVKNDTIKSIYCKNNNIHLIRIPYWEYKNITNILTLQFEKYCYNQ